MSMETVGRKGLVLLGCGKMGSAMLQGWLADGLPVSSVYVLDPYPSDWVQELATQGLNLNSDLPEDPAICVIAVKPQMMGDALPTLQAVSQSDTVFLSIAAGTSIASFEEALIGNATSDANDVALCETLLKAVGLTVVLDSEDQMDAVTAVSGSGPAYVFHLIETLAQAGQAQGLSEQLSLQLAKATVSGAGALAMAADEDPSQLRVNVTSPGGTTQAALNVLMNEKTGFPKVLDDAVKAAAERSRELGKS